MKKNPLKMLWLAAAFLCLGIGAVGVVLPILPTTPFLLVASFCFARGSERFHKWFMGTRIYKNHLDSFVKERAMTLKTKLCILLPASAMLMCAFFMMSNLPGRIFILLFLRFLHHHCNKAHLHASFQSYPIQYICPHHLVLKTVQEYHLRPFQEFPKFFEDSAQSLSF